MPPVVLKQQLLQDMYLCFLQGDALAPSSHAALRLVPVTGFTFARLKIQGTGSFAIFLQAGHSRPLPTIQRVRGKKGNGEERKQGK